MCGADDGNRTRVFSLGRFCRPAFSRIATRRGRRWRHSSLALRPAIFAVTLGDGSFAICADGDERIPAYLTEIVDTAGAGDALKTGGSTRSRTSRFVGGAYRRATRRSSTQWNHSRSGRKVAPNRLIPTSNHMCKPFRWAGRLSSVI